MRDGTPPRPPSRPTSYGCPTLLPIASTVVPASSAKAVRFPCGWTNTSVPSGASTVFAVDLEPRAAAEDDVELLAALVLLVLGHEPVALVGGRPRIRPERGDPEVMAHRPHVRVLAVGDVLQFVDRRNPIAHNRPTPFNDERSQRAGSLILFDYHKLPRSEPGVRGGWRRAR